MRPVDRSTKRISAASGLSMSIQTTSGPLQRWPTGGWVGFFRHARMQGEHAASLADIPKASGNFARAPRPAMRRPVSCPKLSAGSQISPSPGDSDASHQRNRPKILKREGVEWLIGYPVNPIIEGAAQRQRTSARSWCRQERIGLHHVRRGQCQEHARADKVGVFVMQHGPGHRERLWRRRAVLRRTRLPGGRAAGGIRAQHQSGAAELQRRAELPQRHQDVRAGARSPTRRSRRCAALFTMVRSSAARGRCWSNFPTDILRYGRARMSWSSRIQAKAPRLKSGPDSTQSVSQIAEALVSAERPIIHVGQGVHYAKA